VRPRVYVPPRIESAETNAAVTDLALALWKSGACDFVDAKERICRLLGWMCEQNTPETPPDGE
jgi:hypothetical protein